MNYIEKAKKEIKDYWFKNHQAQIKGEEGFQVLYWCQSGTNSYFTKYILSGGDLIVTGDIGEAVFSLTCKATLENIKEFDLHYLLRKLKAYSGERWNFNENKARNELNEWFKEKKENEIDSSGDVEGLYLDLDRATQEWSMQRHFQTAVFSIYDHTDVEWFDSEEASVVSEFGKEIPYHLIAYWVGLQMAIEQLSQKEETIAK